MPATGSAAAKPPGDALPGYSTELSAFHRAFTPELRAIIRSLPMNSQMEVLDVGCGDGFFLSLLAERLRLPGRATGLDIDPAYLATAREHVVQSQVEGQVEFIQGELRELSQSERRWDFVWCAQSLFTLPEPVSTLRQIAQLLRPGGIAAVLENDTLHQLLLPWPPHLEIALRAAELAELSRESPRPAKFYVGRRLPQVFAAAGLNPLSFRTQCIDRQWPIDGDLELFLQLYFERLMERVQPHLDPELALEFKELIDPSGPRYLLSQRHFTLSWINVLVWGRRDLGGTD